MTEKYTLKQWRGIKGWSQNELADAAGLTTRTIYDYESGATSLVNAKHGNVKQLAKALGIKVEDIDMGDD